MRSLYLPVACLAGLALSTAAMSSADTSARSGLGSRKKAFLEQRADEWKKAGYPLIQQEGKEWKLNEIEPCWAGAHAMLLLKRNPEEVAKANWFFENAPVDWEVDPDMRLCELLHSYYAFRSDPQFTKAAKEYLLTVFKTTGAPRRIFTSTWNFHATENHAMMGHVWRLLVAQVNGDQAEVAALTKHISEFIVEHARKGWQEFYSPCYQEKEAGCMVMISEWAEDQRLRGLASMMLDMLFAEQSLLTLDGVMCGPCMRAYGAEMVPGDQEPNHNSRRDRMRSGQYSEAGVVFGTGTPHFYGVLGSMCLASSGYEPPQLVSMLGASEVSKGTYELVARKPGNKFGSFRNGDVVPTEDAFNARVYCYVAEGFVLGTSQEVPGRFGVAGGRPDSLNASLVVRGSPQKTIYFDCSERPVHLYQYRNVLLGQNGVGSAYVATQVLGKPVEAGSWVLLKDDSVYVALRPARGGWAWRGVQSKYVFGDYLDFDDRTSPFVMEVASPSDYGGDFDAFKADILDNKLQVTGNNGLVYESCSSGKSGPSAERFTVELRPGDLPRVNGKDADLQSYPTLQSPYVKSEWNSGQVTVSFGGQSLVLDFEKAERKTGIAK